MKKELAQLAVITLALPQPAHHLAQCLLAADTTLDHDQREFMIDCLTAEGTPPEPPTRACEAVVACRNARDAGDRAGQSAAWSVLGECEAKREAAQALIWFDVVSGREKVPLH